MAGDVQEPFGLSFQVDSLHSGSISFGRFEVESLSWERRSSFSHNRYLEEVEKYARPGSVTEKKAYFEAHFRRKALERQASLDSRVEEDRSIHESGSYNTGTYDSGNWKHTEEPQVADENGDFCQWDESPEGSSFDGDSKGIVHEVLFTNDAHSEPQTGSTNIRQLDENPNSSNSLGGFEVGDFECGMFDVEARTIEHSESHLESSPNNVNVVEDVVKCSDNEQQCQSGYGHDGVLMATVEHDIKVESKSNDQALDVLKDEYYSHSKKAASYGLEVLQTDALKSRVEDKSRSSGIKARSQGNVSLICKPGPRKGIVQNNGWRERQTPSRTKTQKQVSQSIGSSLQSSLRISKKENTSSLKAKSSFVHKRDKEPRPKRAVTPQPSTPERTESRGRPSATRTNQITSSNKEIKQCAMNKSMRSVEGADKRREKKAAEIRQLRRNPKFEAKPMSSFCNGTVPRGSIGEKSQMFRNSSRSSSKEPSKSLPFSNIGENKAIIPSSKSSGSYASLGRKELSGKKKESGGKKQDVMKGKTIDTRQKKVGTGTIGNSDMRKNISHPTVVSVAS